VIDDPGETSVPTILLILIGAVAWVTVYHL